ncbi:MAG TPA: SBBP repeat-containing protein, partial [Flavobacterium sp.]|nr:SBBP repeat-containing protein [Flavobacterium sp.]
VVWSARAGGVVGDAGFDVAADFNGNIYATGYFSGTVEFGDKTLTWDGYNDIFLAKYDLNGNCLWAKKAGGASIDIGLGLGIDVYGNPYVCGTYFGNATFGNSSTSGPEQEIFAAKYDPAGNEQWVLSGGGLQGDYGQDLAIDILGNIYLTGNYNYFCSFGDLNMDKSNNTDVFLVKINPLLNSIIPEEKNIAEVVIFPNPFVNSINFTLGNYSTTEYRFTVNSIVGNEVLSGMIAANSRNVEINLPVEMKPGAYFFTLFSPAGTITKKLVKL